MQQDDPSAVISQAALADTSAHSAGRPRFLRGTLYGAEAGNLALKLMATAGVYIGGGIAPKILRKLTDSTFMAAFVAKGRLKPLLQQIPVRIIMNDKVALLGAARFATLRAVVKMAGRTDMVKFAPSILAADFWRLGEQVKAAEEAGASRFHIDVMDGRFVPNISLGMPIGSHATGYSLPLEMHLMIQSPNAMWRRLSRRAPTSSSSIKKPPRICTGPSN